MCSSDLFVGFVFIELQDALHLDFEQLKNVVFCYLTNQARIVRRQALIDMFAHLVDIRRFLEFLVFINTLFDEDALQRLEVQLLKQLAFTNLQLLTNQVLCAISRVSQNVAHGEELGLVVLDDAAVGRKTYLAVGKGIERVNSLDRKSVV